MSHYRRLRIPGGTYAFTVCLDDRASRLLVEEVALLRHAVRLCLKQRPFHIDCAVILPDRLHMIWTLPPGDSDYSARWRMIKSTFSRHLPPPAALCRSKRERGEKGLWQRRFWEHAIRDPADLACHRAAILTAPVRAGLVARPEDWPLSSIHRDGGGALAPVVLAPVALAPVALAPVALAPVALAPVALAPVPMGVLAVHPL